MEDSMTTLERDREFISQEIFNSGKFEDILYSLYSSNAIPLETYQSFVSETSSGIGQVRRLIRYLCRDRELIEVFTQALLKEALNDLAYLINPRISSPLSRDPSHEFSDKLTMLPHIPPSSSYPSISTMPHDILPSGSLSFPDGLNDRPADPLKIKVVKSYTVFGTDKNDEEVYKNSSVPRGLVFIANYQKFQNNRHEERRGSQVDVKNICDLFTQMGYKVIEPFVDLTRTETLKAIRNFRERPDLAYVDSCVVIIMSHGHDDKSFCTWDRYVTDSEVLELFNNHQCPNLKTKPKIFIFQYCRGPTPDLGVENLAVPVSYQTYGEEELETDAASSGLTIPITNLTSFSDIFVIYATYPGYVSFRNPVTGSWLIEAICIEFMNNCNCKDLDTLMKMVSRRVRNLNSDKGRKQVIEFRNVGFDKHFYFNPICYDGLSSFDLNNMHDALLATNNPAITCSLPAGAGLPRVPFPHQLRPIHHELRSRSSTPDSYNELSHSTSGSKLYDLCHSSSMNRLRHASGGRSITSETSELEMEDTVGRKRADSNPSVRPPAPEVFSHPLISSPTTNENELILSTRNGEKRTCSLTGGEDIVDNPKKYHQNKHHSNSNVVLGSAEHFKKYRLEKASKDDSCTRSATPSHFKRQLSIPSERDALRKAHDLQQYFYVNDLDDHARTLEEMKIQIKKNKQKSKRIKQDTVEACNSLEY